MAGNPRFNGTVDLGAYENEAPNAPTNLVATLNKSPQPTVTLTWTDASDNATGFQIYGQAEGDAEESLLVDLPVDATQWTTDVLALGATYRFRVVAIGAKGTATTETLEVAVGDVPAQPTDLTMSNYNPLMGTATLTWNDVENETGYLVQSSVDGGKTWKQLPSLDANATSRRCAGLTDGRSYIYRIAAVNEYGQSEWAETTQFDLTKPVLPTPTNLTMSNYNPLAGTATLTWNDVEGETGYLVQGSFDGGNTWRNLKTLPADATSRACFSLTVPGAYAYRIAAINETGVSEWAEITFVAEKLPTPTNLTTSNYDPLTGTATLTWDDVEGETGYLVQSSVDGGKTWKQLPSLKADATSRLCSGLIDGRSYIYRIAAINETGISEWAETAQFDLTTPALPTPTGLVISNYDPLTGTATLTWNDVEGETGYLVQGSFDGGNTWRNLKTLPTDATSRACLGLTLPGAYAYRIAAINENGVSEWAEIPFVAETLPTPPSNLVMSDYDAVNRTATLTWNQVEGATGYLVQSSVDGGATWRNLPSLAADASSRQCASLTPGNSFIYRIAAINETGMSEWAEILFNAPAAEPVSAALLTSEAFADAFDEFDFFVDEDELDALAKRLV